MFFDHFSQKQTDLQVEAECAKCRQIGDTRGPNSTKRARMGQPWGATLLLELYFKKCFVTCDVYANKGNWLRWCKWIWCYVGNTQQLEGPLTSFNQVDTSQTWLAACTFKETNFTQTIFAGNCFVVFVRLYSTLLYYPTHSTSIHGVLGITIGCKGEAIGATGVVTGGLA